MIFKTLLWILFFLSTFLVMEFMAWFTHKYIMHGFCGSCTKTTITKIMTVGLNAMMPFLFFMQWSVWAVFTFELRGLWACLPIGFGIMAYGATYFIVHDIFIHQRFKMFRKANNWYAKGVREPTKCITSIWEKRQRMFWDVDSPF
ncbi:MAG: beta-carotene hydroxylase [Burkholderiaceae bacterium]|nr:MAG: beta-carotene hydroxylase [Burkholderiaceae bacterium]